MHYLITSLVLFFSTINLQSKEAICDPKAQIILIRHGQADNNVKKINNSNPQSPNYTTANLTDLGKQQVETTAKELLAKGFNDKNIVAVYVSPLPRTRQTAEILSKSGLFSPAKMIIDPRIIEVQFGDAEGLKSLGTLTTVPAEYIKDMHVETIPHIAERVNSFYQSLLKTNPCGNVLVVTHGFIVEKLDELITHKISSKETRNAQADIYPLYSILRLNPSNIANN